MPTRVIDVGNGGGYAGLMYVMIRESGQWRSS